MTSTYPPDEFDVEDPGTGRRGAHRARANPLVAVVPLLLVTLAVVAVIVGAMTVLGGSSGGSAGVPDAGADLPAGTATQEPEQPAAEAPAEEPPPSEPAPEPEPVVDPALPVSVLNGTRTSGLAGAAAEELRAGGWNVVSVDNFRQGDPPPTTVYFAVEGAAATAEAVAEELGVGETALDVSRGEGLVVVLGPDYTP